MGIMQKIAMGAENFDLTKLEVKKIYSYIKKQNKGKVPEMTGWFHSGADDMGFVKVEAEICDAITGERLPDVVLHSCLFDRRQSFIAG